MAGRGLLGRSWRLIKGKTTPSNADTLPLEIFFYHEKHWDVSWVIPLSGQILSGHISSSGIGSPPGTLAPPHCAPGSPKLSVHGLDSCPLASA